MKHKYESYQLTELTIKRMEKVAGLLQDREVACNEIKEMFPHINLSTFLTTMTYRYNIYEYYGENKKKYIGLLK